MKDVCVCVCVCFLKAHVASSQVSTNARKHTHTYTHTGKSTSKQADERGGSNLLIRAVVVKAQHLITKLTTQTAVLEPTHSHVTMRRGGGRQIVNSVFFVLLAHRVNASNKGLLFVLHHLSWFGPLRHRRAEHVQVCSHLR